MAYSWGGDGESKKVFKLQKKVMKLISNAERGTSCRDSFKTLNTLPVPCMYITENVYYIKWNICGIEQNSARHDYNTRHKSDL
jgi:hypothetical protein